MSPAITYDPGPTWPECLRERMQALELTPFLLARLIVERGTPVSTQAVRAWLTGSVPAGARWDAMVSVLCVGAARERTWRVAANRASQSERVSP